VPIVTSDDERMAINAKFADLQRRFSARRWAGPILLDPEEAKRRYGATDGCWQLILQKAEENSRDDPDIFGGGFQAAINITTEQFLHWPVELIARRLALSVAGRAAHEALEWVRLDGELVLNPHTSRADVGDAIEWIGYYFGTV